MNKEERTKTLINNIKLNIDEQNVYEFGLCVEQWKQILDYIGELQQENQKLKKQQRNFIAYLEYQVKLQEELNDIHLATGFEEILQKYKEIIKEVK